MKKENMVRNKPNKIAQKLQIKPAAVSELAKDIEKMNVHRFTQTPLGSYLFSDREAEILCEYYKILNFFKNKKISKKMFLESETFVSFSDFLLEKQRQKEKRPDWLKHLKNLRKK